LENNKRLFKKSFLMCLLSVFFIFPVFVNGATLFTEPVVKNVNVGDTFSISVNANSQGSPINASSLDIKYDTNFLSVLSVGKTGSIFTLWAEEPSYSNIKGVVHFGGGLSSPGWNGGSGNIIRITFKAKSSGQTSLTLQNGSVLANDGIGTEVLSGVKGTVITIAKAPASSPASIEKLPTTVTGSTTGSTTAEVPVDQSFFIPAIENLPDFLHEGETLLFNGVGISSGQIQVYVQKGKGATEVIQIDTKEDGKFNVIYKNPVTSGYYKIWARNVSADGVLSPASDISYVEVINKNTINVFAKNIKYTTLIMVLLLTSILFFILSIIYWILYIRLKNKAFEKEIFRRP
jgi:hypothetical protein